MDCQKPRSCLELGVLSAAPGARSDIVHNLQPRLDEWLQSDYVKTDPFELEKGEVLLNVNAILQRIEQP